MYKYSAQFRTVTYFHFFSNLKQDIIVLGMASDMPIMRVAQPLHSTYVMGPRHCNFLYPSSAGTVFEYDGYRRHILTSKYDHLSRAQLTLLDCESWLVCFPAIVLLNSARICSKVKVSITWSIHWSQFQRLGNVPWYGILKAADPDLEHCDWSIICLTLTPRFALVSFQIKQIWVILTYLDCGCYLIKCLRDILYFGISSSGNLRTWELSSLEVSLAWYTKWI